MSYYNRRRYRPRENSKRILTPTNIPVGSIIYKQPILGKEPSMAVYRYLGVKNNSHVLLRLIDITLNSYVFSHRIPVRTPRVPDSTFHAMSNAEPSDLFRINLSTPKKSLNPGMKITLASIEHYTPIVSFRYYFWNMRPHIIDFVERNSARSISTSELIAIQELYKSFLTPIIDTAHMKIKQKGISPIPPISSPTIFL